LEDKLSTETFDEYLYKRLFWIKKPNIEETTRFILALVSFDKSLKQSITQEKETMCYTVIPWEVLPLCLENIANSY